MKRLAHKFVEYVPEVLEDAVLYISIPFRLISHRCCCGCGEEVVLKLSPCDWRLIFDGENVSIEPSIGNWNLKCRSHYWITKSCVRWAESWTDAEDQMSRRSIKVTRTDPYDPSATNEDSGEEAPRAMDKKPTGLFSKVKRKLRRSKE